MKFFPLISFILISFQVIAQRSIVSTVDTRTIYIGIENDVEIAIPGMKCDSLLLKASECEVKGEGCYYKVSPKQPGFTNFYIVNKSTSAILDTVKIRIKTLPDPQIKIKRGEITNMFIRTGPIPYLPYCEFNVDLKITEFDLKIVRDSNAVFQSLNIGSSYTPECLNAIDKIIPGDMLILSNVKIVGSNNLKWFLQGDVGLLKFY